MIDDKPRENVSIVELRFLKDMATTVMDHIEAGRGTYSRWTLSSTENLSKR